MQEDNSTENSRSHETSSTDHFQSVDTAADSSGQQNENLTGGDIPVQTSQKKGCRYGFLFLFLAISGLLFIGVVGIVVVKLYPEKITDAAEVEAFKNEFAPIDIPDYFTDQFALKTDNFVFKLFLVIYINEEKDTNLVLFDFKINITDDKTQEQEVLNNLLMQMGLIPGDQENIDLEKTEINIDGKPIAYDFKKGIDINNGVMNYMIRGSVPHLKESTAEVIFLTEDEEKILKGVNIIQNMKLKEK